MTGYIQTFFWWCVGADKSVLQKCPRSERIKHAGYGNLILVPTLLALVSMSYAVSTFIGDNRVYLGAGIIWAFIVFAIDRVIVSTFRKRDTISGDIVSVPFLARLILAVLVGFVIAHPLVMFIFNNSIEGRLDERRRIEIQNINTSYDNLINPLEGKKAPLDQSISNVQTQKDEEVKQRESLLIQTIGRRRYGRRANEIRNIRKRLLDERDESIKKINTEKKGLDDKIAEIEKARKAALQGYKQPRDYLARENALSDLTAANDTVRWTQRLIIFLFVFIDILPITLKVVTKKEAYDFLLESSNQRAVDESKMETEIHAEMLKNVTDRQKHKVAEIIESKLQSPEFSTALEADIEAIIKRSLVGGGPAQGTTETFPKSQSSTSVQEPKAEDGQAARKGFSGRLKTRLEDKGIDATIGLVCIPLQALLLFGFYMYFGSDIWQYVSWSTILQIFPLFFVNFVLSKLLKMFID